MQGRTGPASRAFACVVGACLGAFAPGQVIPVIDGVSFAAEPSVLYAPIKPLGYRLGWEMRSEGKSFFVNDRPINDFKVLPDGTKLIDVRNLAHLGLQPTASEDGSEFSIQGGLREVVVRKGEKRVVINKKEQKLRAYQGDLLVIETHVSTGRRGFTTPSGTWSAGPEKVRLRYSRKYENAPMPWAVQIAGGYFMHGYGSVPRRPASHGCVRLPLRGMNPARYIWNWIDLGTPITIGNEWDDETRGSLPAGKKDAGPETIPIQTNPRRRP